MYLADLFHGELHKAVRTSSGEEQADEPFASSKPSFATKSIFLPFCLQRGENHYP
jgi:hypothetical protein